GGLGIGLALVAQLVDAHGGRVQAHSDGEGKGACFTVWLPLSNQSKALQADADSEEAQGLNGMRVLLVDDSPELLETLGMLCEMNGADVTTADNARSALALMAVNDYDVLVSDIGMSEMDGC